MPPSRVVARACAKVNLSLDVGPRRPDGYHSLRSVMQTVSLADTVEIERTSTATVTLTCTAADIPGADSNTAAIAVRAVLQRLGLPIGLHITLHKRIPAQAGLGGGSSDAAAALRAVAVLVGWSPDLQDMASVAAEIGSDVPFLLAGGTALVEGRGEIVTPMAPAPTMHLVIVKPDGGVPTGPAYAALDNLTDRAPGSATARVVEALVDGHVGRIAGAMANDFEAVVPRLCAGVAEARDALLEAGLTVARLCGSGSAVFGVVSAADEAQSVCAKIADRFPFAAACHTVGSAHATTVEALE